MARVNYPEPVLHLLTELKRLPGVGPMSAERMMLALLQDPRVSPQDLATALEDAAREVLACSRCGFFATAQGCSICDDSKRDAGRICVVEQPAEVLPIERAGAFQGFYHCLGGKLSPLDNVTPEDLRIGSLLKRVKASPERVEVILAVGADVEGEATAGYLGDVLEGLNCEVSRLAQGLPAGRSLEFADELTLMRAFEGRRGL